MAPRSSGGRRADPPTPVVRRFSDRREAGAALGARLARLDLLDPVVLALPRGGVPVGFEVARALRAPLDVIGVRKLGVPWHRELALGAVGERGVLVRNDDVLATTHVSSSQLAALADAARHELDRSVATFRDGRAPVSVSGRTAVVVDDGVATGATMRSGCEVAAALGAVRVVAAIPVAAPDALAELEGAADEIVCLVTPTPFFAVGAWYDDFAAVRDEEVTALLRLARGEDPGSGALLPGER